MHRHLFPLPALAIALSVLLICVGPASAAVEVVDIERVSVAPDGTQANGGSWAPAVSGDGTIVAFQSFASNLVAGDAAFLHRALGIADEPGAIPHSSNTE